MPAASRNVLSEFFFRIHPWIYRKSGGRILSSFGNDPILLLNTIGRRSGLPRTNGLVYVEHDNGWIVAASWAGEPKHPIWYLNLMAKPEVTVQVRDRVINVCARNLEGEERERGWGKIIEQDPSFAEYEKRTDGIRQIPVVFLEPHEPQSNSDEYILYGLSCSYFTGKLEAYLKNKGIPYRYVEMTTAQHLKCSIATGVSQLPCVQTPDGSWLTDTTVIIDHFEKQAGGLKLRPQDSAAAFCSLLLEDLFDEWYWRPALYYRWSPEEDSRLMSRWLARTFLADQKKPLFLRRRFMLKRQRIVYLKKDGVTKKTAPAIEALYLDSLRALEVIFSKRPFLLGDRPSEADYGLFGPFFRHFFCDPTPGALMREHAPNLAHWVTRLWASRPVDIEKTSPVTSVPDDLSFFFNMVSNDYLPYLEANALAVTTGAKMVRYRSQGVDWNVPTTPYRAQCLNELKERFAALDSDAVNRVTDLLSVDAINVLRGTATHVEIGVDKLGRTGRLGRAPQLFD